MSFASDGHEPWPPLDQDNEDVRNFSDRHKWPESKLIGRLGRYSRFLEWESPMKRARDKANRIITHILFEVPYRGIVLTIPDESDCPTEPIDSEALRRALEDDVA